VFAIELQQSFESVVDGEASLLAAARKAFQSFIRAYAAYGKDVKHIFAVRGLHLGHVAKSFGLKIPPTGIKVGSGTKVPVDKKGVSPRGIDSAAEAEGLALVKSLQPKKKKRLRNNAKVMRQLTTSEFAAA